MWNTGIPFDAIMSLGINCGFEFFDEVDFMWLLKIMMSPLKIHERQRGSIRLWCYWLLHCMYPFASLGLKLTVYRHLYTCIFCLFELIMANDLVNSATSEKLTEMDWSKNIEICESVARDQRLAKDVIKAIKKRLGNKNPNVQLYAVLLLEMLMGNIGEHIHRLVIDATLLPILVKIVKKKSDFPVRERIFLLLDATQTSLGGASGKFPQYYHAYYELVSAGVQFPGRPCAVSSNLPSSGARQINLTIREVASANQERVKPREDPQVPPESSIIQKASAALEVLREVLGAVDVQNLEGAKDEFTLDLVEQCSFQKQRVMHLVMSSRDERLVSRAIELNEQLGKVLARHDELLLGRSTSISNHCDNNGTLFKRHDAVPLGKPTLTSNGIDQEEADEEEAEQLSRRIRKGKARVRPEDEDISADKPFGLLGTSVPSERLYRPLIRPLSLESLSHESKPFPTATAIPPPPAKHAERERFFQEKRGDGAALPGHIRQLSLHSRTPSSSYNGSLDSIE
ncbi:hypothetical protein Nepgr_001401 [Nepenthes gracilis]|uniref:Target of Myb protein 1 n=1 Tax=Nepenthes gracilis TaxID=150966 RepID=A0AAD3P554_NEPGR|nr:hypothetical protein Nepgr_001401 [Nepenthes gracilis]